MKKTLIIFLTIVILYFFYEMLTEPKLDRNWVKDQKILAKIDFKDSGLVTIKNIRNSYYRTTDDFDLLYYNKTFNINQLNSIWYIVEPLSKLGIAHTFVSFGFDDGSYLAISIEIRREKGENFNAFTGMFRKFELMYVIADEEDVIKLRTNHRKNEVRLFPIKADKKVLKQLFISMLKQAQNLTTQPEFYNTITSNCTTNIVRHIHEVSSLDITKWDIRYLLTEFSDEIAFNVGIVDTNLTIQNAREYFSITEKAQLCTKSQENFSSCIRK